MKRFLFIGILLISIASCQSQDCNKLPIRFDSYSQAISLIKNSSFKITESANTSNSSWISSAKYYSCDGNTGYFIYTTNKGYEYIHSQVPRYIWEGFKNAASKGSYYNDKLKDNYQLKLY